MNGLFLTEYPTSTTTNDTSLYHFNNNVDKLSNDVVRQQLAESVDTVQKLHHQIQVMKCELDKVNK